MAFDMPILRISAYAVLTVFSFILLCLCAARIHYTENLPRGDTLNRGRDFYDPVVAELLAASLLTIFWAPFMIYTIWTRAEFKYVYRFREELAGLFVLWLLWIGGAGAATNLWGDLSFCQQFEPCRILSALLAFTWLGWLVLTVILGISLMFVFGNGALMEPLHGQWHDDPRHSRPMSQV